MSSAHALWVKSTHALTRTAGKMAVGGRMCSTSSPKSHSGLSWAAHLLCNWSIKQNTEFEFVTSASIFSSKCSRTVLWHQRQWDPEIPLKVFTDLRQCSQRPGQLPSTQWCIMGWKPQHVGQNTGTKLSWVVEGRSSTHLHCFLRFDVGDNTAGRCCLYATLVYSVLAD